MRWHTHVVCGISTLWLLTPFASQNAVANLGLLAACAAFGALLPDLDAAESKIKHLRFCRIKPFTLPSIAIHQELGHRGLVHSLAGLAVFSVATIPLLSYTGWQPSLALVLGYVSHLVADACTKSGIPWFYPRRKCYHLLPRFWRLVTGSQVEEVLFAFAAASTLLLLFSHLPSH